MENKKVRCKICNSLNEGIILAHYNLKLCLKCFPIFFKNRIDETVKKFKMFQLSDPILIGLSGGKDSISLTKALKELGYKIRALHINIGIDGISEKTEEFVKNFCENEKVDLKIIKLKELFPLPLYKLSKITKKPICAVCGMIRRYIMNMESKEEIIVTGHTLNDEVSFIIKNLLFWNDDLLSRTNPVLVEKQGLSRKAKPLCLTTEKETTLFCKVLGIKYINEPCPYKSEIYEVFKDITIKLNETFPASIIGVYTG
ncbi:MAG: tRNA 2-thiocytidine biosynthesis TtcA family protein [Proteobacteria bacterium]|nr:tRNA 2-thiocytidine biosynthesis TtcA family protein [Pseudomonadota bacterium]